MRQILFGMTFIDCFSQVEDPRRKQGLRVDLEQILIMTVVSYLAGHIGYRGVARFSQENADYFVPELQLRHGIPSHVTFREVLMNIDETELIIAFNRWSQQYIPLQTEDWISTDGKTLGSTVVDSQGRSQDFEGVVSLFCSKSGLVCSIEHYRRKSKEKAEAPLARHIMSSLKNKGLIYTMDAHNTQKNDKNSG